MIGGGLLMLVGLNKRSTGQTPPLTQADRVIVNSLPSGLNARGTTLAQTQPADMVTGTTALNITKTVLSVAAPFVIGAVVANANTIVQAIATFLSTSVGVACVIFAIAVVATVISAHFVSRAMEWGAWYGLKPAERYTAEIRRSINSFADGYARTREAGIACEGRPNLSLPPDPRIDVQYQTGNLQIKATSVAGFGAFGSAPLSPEAAMGWYQLKINGISVADNTIAFTLGLFFAIRQQWAFNKTLRRFYKEVKQWSEGQQLTSNMTMPEDVFWGFVNGQLLRDPVIVGGAWNNGITFDFPEFPALQNTVRSIAPNLYDTLEATAEAIGTIKALSRVVQEHSNNDWFLFWPGDLAYSQVIQAHTADWTLVVAPDWQGVDRPHLQDPKTGALFNILGSRASGGPVFVFMNSDPCKVA